MYSRFNKRSRKNKLKIDFTKWFKLFTIIRRIYYSFINSDLCNSKK